MENPSINKPATYLIAGIAFLFVAVPLHIMFIWAMLRLFRYPVHIDYNSIYLTCQASLKERTLREQLNWHLFSWLHLLFPYLYVLIGFLLIKKHERKGIAKSFRTWLGLMMVITPLYDASWGVFMRVYDYLFRKDLFWEYHTFDKVSDYIKLILDVILPFIIAIIIHQKFFNRREQIRLWAISFPAFLVTAYIWFWWLGRLILPTTAP